jgi:hypothetical protein
MNSTTLYVMYGQFTAHVYIQWKNLKVRDSKNDSRVRALYTVKEWRRQDGVARSEEIIQMLHCGYFDKLRCKKCNNTRNAQPFDRDRFPTFTFGPAALTPPIVFFLLMPRRLSEGYSHLIERRWHWLINYTGISHMYFREYGVATIYHH